MAEHDGEKERSAAAAAAGEESLLDKITEKFDDSSSDSDDDKHSLANVKAKIYRIFGRDKPLHHVLGGGKTADVLLWRDKNVSSGVLGFATLIWVLFELLEYHLVTLLCHALILGLSILFLWSNVSTFIKKSPPQFPEIVLSEGIVLGVASVLQVEINRALAILREIASGKDLKKFLAISAGLWFASIVGSWCSFLTFFYICFVLLHTVPMFYEQYEDQVDPLAEKALAEFKKQYAVFDAKVLSQIPRGPLKDKKLA